MKFTYQTIELDWNMYCYGIQNVSEGACKYGVNSESLECHKQIHSTESSLHDYFIVKENNRVTRESKTKTMKIPNFKTSTGWKAFEYQGPDHWNRLDATAKDITNINKFRTHITKGLVRDVNH